MELQQRLTSFAILEGSWIMWLLVGFSMGGTVMFLQRAYYLICSSVRRRRRRAQAHRAAARAGDVGVASVVHMSSPGLSLC